MFYNIIRQAEMEAVFFRFSGRQLANFNYQYFPGVDTHTTHAGGSILHFMTGRNPQTNIYGHWETHCIW